MGNVTKRLVVNTTFSNNDLINKDGENLNAPTKKNTSYTDFKDPSLKVDIVNITRYNHIKELYAPVRRNFDDVVNN